MLFYVGIDARKTAAIFCARVAMMKQIERRLPSSPTAETIQKIILGMNHCLIYPFGAEIGTSAPRTTPQRDLLTKNLKSRKLLRIQVFFMNTEALINGKCRLNINGTHASM